MLSADITYSRRPPGALGGFLRHGLVLALIAVALIFALHHLPPLSQHTLMTVIAVVAAAALVTSLAGVAIAREQVSLPIVIAATSDLEIRRMNDGDLDFSAALHATELGHGFFVSLGPAFIRAYHRTFLESPHAIAISSTLGGHRVGFLVGALDPAAHAQWVLRHRGTGLALRGAAALAARPLVGMRFLRGRLRRYATSWRRHRGPKSAGSSELKADSHPAVLSHVAVAPGARGTGAGRKLVRAFETTAGELGTGRAILTTLEGPDGAGAFYERLGWTPCGTEDTPDGPRMEGWTRTLGEGA